MKIRLLVVFIAFVSCTTATQYGMPDTDPNLIQQDFMKWYTYHYNTIILSSDFKAIDENSKIINKKFLKKTNIRKIHSNSISIKKRSTILQTIQIRTKLQSKHTKHY